MDQRVVASMGPVVQQFLTAYEAGWAKPAEGGLARIWAPEALMTHPEFDEPVVGRDAILKYLDDVLAMAPDLRVEPLDAAWNEPILFVLFRAEATFNGTHVTWEGVDRFMLEDGVAVRGDGYFDTTALRQALGVTG